VFGKRIAQNVYESNFFEKLIYYDYYYAARGYFPEATVKII
jgi:hypothetical protein